MSTEELFAGKVVQIYVAKPANGGMFTNVRIENLEGHDFIVGTLASHPAWNDARDGMPFWIALDSVQMFTVFPDIETAVKSYDENVEAHKKRTNRRRRHWWN